MGNVHPIERATSTTLEDNRATIRRRVLIRASMRLRGKAEEWLLTVKDISSTGMRAHSKVCILPGTRLDIELPNIGWIPGEVVRTEGVGVIGVRFGAIIDPARTQVPVSGSYGASPSSPTQLRRI
jgi:hypothetical protein